MGFQNFNTSIIMQVCLRLISGPSTAYGVWRSILATCLLGSIPPSSKSSSVPPGRLFTCSDSPAMVIGIFSQWWVRTRHPRWFTKYKYVPFPVSRSSNLRRFQLHCRRRLGWWNSGHQFHPQFRECSNAETQFSTHSILLDRPCSARQARRARSRTGGAMVRLVPGLLGVRRSPFSFTQISASRQIDACCLITERRAVKYARSTGGVILFRHIFPPRYIHGLDSIVGLIKHGWA